MITRQLHTLHGELEEFTEGRNVSVFRLTQLAHDIRLVLPVLQKLDHADNVLVAPLNGEAGGHQF